MYVAPDARDGDFRVRLDVSPGWTIQDGAERLLTPDEDGDMSTTFAVIATADAPAALIATVRVDDPSGEFYGTTARRRFVAPTTTTEITARSALSATATAEWPTASGEVDAVFADAEGATATVTTVAALDALPAEIAASLAASETSAEVLYSSEPVGAMATMSSGCSLVTHNVSGYLGFWDVRDTKSSAAGSRNPTCDTSVTNCNTGATNCCYQPVQNTMVWLYSLTDGAFMGIPNMTDDAGYFGLWDDCWEPGKDYRIYVQFKSIGVWGEATILNSSSATDATYWGLATFDMDQGPDTTLSVHVNDASNPYTTAGEDANLFATVQRTFQAVGNGQGGENDSRLRNGYQSSSMQRIYVRYYGTTTGYNCATREIWVPDGQAVGQTPVWLLGYLYMGGVTGCINAQAAYPDYHGDQYNWTTGEGNALVAAIPSTLLTVSYWDPQVAPNTNLYTYLWPCYFDTYSNSNRASAERNDFLALWEFIDADTGATSKYGTDQLDLTLGQVMDGLVHLRDTAGTPQQNRTNAEAVWVYIGGNCSTSEQCSPGHACLGGTCHTGDPHGENIRDLTYHVWAVNGGSESTYVSTLRSSQCIGTYDDTYPYQAGYRED